VLQAVILADLEAREERAVQPGLSEWDGGHDVIFGGQ
jgi:hypothetical protein